MCVIEGCAGSAPDIEHPVTLADAGMGYESPVGLRVTTEQGVETCLQTRPTLDLSVFLRDQRASNASISLGNTLCTSPTTPRSATEKIGASGSLFMAMMVLESFIPTMCCMAPDTPAAM